MRKKINTRTPRIPKKKNYGLTLKAVNHVEVVCWVSFTHNQFGTPVVCDGDYILLVIDFTARPTKFWDWYKWETDGFELMVPLYFDW